MRRRASDERGAAPIGAAAPAAVLGLIAASFLSAGCYPPQLLTLRPALDSLRVVVDTLVARDAVAYRTLMDTRREIAEQRDVLLSTRATTGTTTQQLFDQMGRLEARLDEVGSRFQQWNQRNPATAPAAAGVDANTLYDQAALDLTQGRYSMALEGFRDFVRRFPAAELADNAQYGAGECFFAQARFDSAAVEYARVEPGWPQGDKIPAALYKLALCQDKLQQGAQSKKSLEELVKRFPLSGEAQLARERLGTGRR